ncbi:mitochondrial folate transporter/carrier-like isoform X1 [Mercenaria mercenaria]|uniref:mitochondrial folate transporter/carrier-like isoform X1 n=1 Tax=Mercenaria mercenaria TaxID=6596 RepID=UPI001E1DCA7E|nr:mitochondrial folate transporter/carrier-like isoform X1 [Mercenaria mercenaria]
MDRSRTSMTSRPAPKSLLQHVKWEYLAAGISGGVVSTLVLHPLDLVKIRFQVHEGYGVAVTKRPQYQGMFHALRSIFSTGGFTGLYQGVTPNVWGAGISWGLYFFFYNSIKTWMQEGDTTRALGATKHILIASEAGLLTLVLTNPIWVAKTRLCLQYESKPTDCIRYNGTLDALIKLYKYEGVRGLYKGFVPGVFGISHGAIQFMAYEEMKNAYNQNKKRPVDTRLTTVEYLTFAAVSKILAACITYPYQVLRARLQDQHVSYSGVIDVVQKILKHEGGYGFYKGLFPALLRVTPACCITFIVYENLITYLLHSDKNNNGAGQIEDKLDVSVNEDMFVEGEEDMPKTKLTDNNSARREKTV